MWKLAAPLLHRLDPERAHGLALWALERGLAGGPAESDDPALGLELWGRRFANPVGLAAGFDKDARAPVQALKLGFGFVEVGSVTPRPQPGNSKPRLFRLAEDGAVINRMGFNNDGHAAALARLRKLAARPGPIAVNLGANKDSADPAADYAQGVAAFAGLADLFVVNVSSPNTPGLRELQRVERLKGLLAGVLAARDARAAGAPVLVKLAPDLDDAQLAEIAQAALAAPIDGAILSNTTIGRPAGLRSRFKAEAGGLSGRPLFDASTERLRAFRRLVGPKLPLVGVGGVESGETAYAKIRAGASLVELYSALVFEGPALVGRIKRELSALLRRDGFRSVGEAVGVDA
jgi:dihydroorotate dehydrogenase